MGLQTEHVAPEPGRMIFPEDVLNLSIKNLGNSSYPYEYCKPVVVAKIADGGFYGPVIIPEADNFVVKTTQPADYHHLLRLMNWGLKAFPPQINEAAAGMDHLAARLIHQIIPAATAGECYAPDSLGYTHIEGRGFAQLIEKINGRPARFDLPEYPEFKSAQVTLSEAGFRFGFEQAAQVDPNNPFGLANVWRDLDRECFTWLDTLPAMPHKPVMGIVPFEFQSDTRRRFHGSDYLNHPPTFNTVHTDITRAEVERMRTSFDNASYNEIMSNLDRYDQLKLDFDTNYHPKRQVSEAINIAVRLAGTSLIDLAKMPFTKTAKGIFDTFNLAFNSQAQIDTALSGIREARRNNLVSSNELLEAENLFENYSIWRRENLVAAVPPVIFLGIGSASWAVAGYYGIEMYQAGQLLEQGISLDSAADLLKIYGARWLLSNTPKAIVSEGVTRLSSVNFRPAFLTSLIPVVGDYISPVGHLAGEAANSDPQVLHYLVRKACADISGIIPSGGIGSEFEAWIYRNFGVKIEGLFQAKES